MFGWTLPPVPYSPHVRTVCQRTCITRVLFGCAGLPSLMPCSLGENSLLHTNAPHKTMALSNTTLPHAFPSLCKLHAVPTRTQRLPWKNHVRRCAAVESFLCPAAVCPVQQIILHTHGDKAFLSDENCMRQQHSPCPSAFVAFVHLP